MDRTRTVTWENPLRGAEAARGMSGMEYLHAIREGRIPPPPVAVLLGFGIAEIGEGRVTFRLQPAEYHYNPIGSVHGGVLATLCDSAMGCAVHTLLPAGTGYTTLEFKVNFLRRLTLAASEITCEGKIIHLGRRVATAEARVFDAAGSLFAQATTTCLLFTAEDLTREVEPRARG